MTRLKWMWIKILNVFFPLTDHCQVCFKPQEASPVLLCKSCEQALEPIRAACKICGYPLKKDDDSLCRGCHSTHSVLDDLYCGYLSNEETNQWVYKYKYHHKRHLCHVFSRLIFSMPLDWSCYDMIVPVPSIKQKIRTRGADHIWDIGEELSLLTGLPLVRGLKRNHHQKAQVELGRLARQLNMEGAFEVVTKDLKSKRVLLIDDIFTTGATLETAAEVLHRSGCHVTGCTVFRTHKKTNSRS